MSNPLTDIDLKLALDRYEKHKRNTGWDTTAKGLRDHYADGWNYVNNLWKEDREQIMEELAAAIVQDDMALISILYDKLKSK